MLRALLATVALIALGCARSASAQQAIVSMPSADNTPKGEFFFMHETQVRPYSPKPYWNTTHFFTYGVSDHVEAAVTLFNVGVPWPKAATIAIGGKANIDLLPKRFAAHELKLTVGMMGLASFEGQGVGYWLYGHVNARVPVLRTRLAAGVSLGTRQLFARDTICFIGSVEQPVPGTKEKLNVVAEWFSGDHDLANFIAGLTYHPNHTWIFVAGWKVPTARSDAFRQNKMAAVLEIGAFF